jgi:hypothetical protein
MADSVDPFAPARQALERGDYGRVRALLEPLVATHPPATKAGAELQLLLATAWMGQGENVRAMACCRQVKRCSDPQLRGQAREMLAVLEAPALERPREWSITLPELGDAEPLAGRLMQASRRRRRQEPPPPPPPPVGPTRAPIGFAALVLSLLLVGLLLGGCVQMTAELRFGGPGRLQLVEELATPTGQPPLAWQRHYATALRQLGLRGPARAGASSERLSSAMQPAAATLGLLQASLEEAGRLAGLELPAPTVQWRERNWLLGVRQRLAIELDLRAADPVPGLEANLQLQPLRRRAVRLAVPQAVAALEGTDVPTLRWPLQLGALNRLELSCWRWSPLGLGAVAIALAFSLVLCLASLRQRLGFGWPQLPA